MRRLCASPVSQVFLTGATGFLGGELAVVLSRTHSFEKIVCLVRARSDEEANDRLERVFALHHDSYDRNHVLAIAGDLTNESLTAQLATHPALQHIGVIVHAAANTSFLPQKYCAVSETNVEGTLRIVRWASRLSSLRTFCYVGTASIIGAGADVVGRTICEDESPNLCAEHVVGYTRSKMLAEMSVRATIPHQKLLVVRPSIVLGDTRCIVPRSFDIAWIIIAVQQLRLFFSNPDAACDIIPVDYAAAAIVALLQARRRYVTYHISAGICATTCRQIGAAANSVAACDKPPLLFCPRGDLDLVKKWLRSDEGLDSGLSKYAEQLQYIRHGIGTKKARLLLSGLEAYWRFIDLDQRFDNSRLLADTEIGLPEPAHEYLKRTLSFLSDIDPVTAALSP